MPVVRVPVAALMPVAVLLQPDPKAAHQLKKVREMTVIDRYKAFKRTCIETVWEIVVIAVAAAPWLKCLQWQTVLSLGAVL